MNNLSFQTAYLGIIPKKKMNSMKEQHKMLLFLSSLTGTKNTMQTINRNLNIYAYKYMQYTV